MATMSLIVPRQLAANCRTSAERQKWLEQLPQRVDELASRWTVTLGPPFDNDETSSAWVAPARRADGTPVVLKVALPHMEGTHEIAGLRFWNGDPTVQVIDADERLGGMLLERCIPGTLLRCLPEPNQDVVIAALLRRLWRAPSEASVFRPLSELTAFWANETVTDACRWPDRGLVDAGLQLFRELPQSAESHVLLATDLHAGNVLRAEREPWLVIDPKPFVGDPAYDATQHLFNCVARLSADPDATIGRVADLLGVDRERVRLWTFARAAAEPRDDWQDPMRVTLARKLVP
jgi:streptomycin 6-kinase